MNLGRLAIKQIDVRAMAVSPEVILSIHDDLWFDIHTRMMPATYDELPHRLLRVALKQTIMEVLDERG